MATAAKTRLTRLIRLLGLLQAGKRLGVDELAKAAGVSRRTVFRDLKLLHAAEVPVEFNKAEQRYWIAENYFLAPTNFTPEEALSLSVLCRELGGKKGLPLHTAAQTAALKLEGGLPSALVDLLRETTGRVHVRPHAVNPLDGQETIFGCLQTALGKRLKVRVEYVSFSENTALTTLLSPYHLLFARRSWYVVAHSSKHSEVRTFNIGRIRKCDSTATMFKRPARFTIEKYLGNAWSLMPESGPDKKVRVHFLPLVARNVAEIAWHKTQRCTFADDGSLLYEASVSGLTEISWWILGYGDQAEVLGPPELRKIVSERAENMAAMYADNTTPR